MVFLYFHYTIPPLKKQSHIFIKLTPRLRNNCAEPIYNFGNDDIESITQERERRSPPTKRQIDENRYRSNSLTEQRKPADKEVIAGKNALMRREK